MNNQELKTTVKIEKKSLLKSVGDYQIRFMDALDEDIEKRMMKGFVDYEKVHGIDVNYRSFALTISHENGGVLGAIMAYTVFSEIYVDNIWVDSAHQRKGYGKQLLGVLEEHFKGQGFNNINLVTNAFQAPEFYKKCGFTEEFTRINTKNPKLSKIFFVKFFNEAVENQGIRQDE